ncbi:hypothetical protein [Nostoc sp. ChiVER01]|nr:hypothetical protein [Nostoc sp. ChiVER01]MDZ8224801.1 hypothetical protein [Nostoc sp. ChiVER01]
MLLFLFLQRNLRAIIWLLRVYQFQLTIKFSDRLRFEVGHYPIPEKSNAYLRPRHREHSFYFSPIPVNEIDLNLET